MLKCSPRATTSAPPPRPPRGPWRSARKPSPPPPPLSKAAAGNCRTPAPPSASSCNPPTSSHRRRPRRHRGPLLGRPPSRRPNLHRPAGHLAQRTLDAMLRRQGLELHRRRPDQRHPILVPGQRHRRRRPQRLERPRHQTRHLNKAQLPGRG